MDKINPRWDYGIFVVVRPRSEELWIATPEGVTRTGSARRIPVRSRWSEDTLKWVQNIPWLLYKGHDGADGDIPEERIST